MGQAACACRRVADAGNCRTLGWATRRLAPLRSRRDRRRRTVDRRSPDPLGPSSSSDFRFISFSLSSFAKLLVLEFERCSASKHSAASNAVIVRDESCFPFDWWPLQQLRTKTLGYNLQVLVCSCCCFWLTDSFVHTRRGFVHGRLKAPDAPMREPLYCCIQYSYSELLCHFVRDFV